MSATASVDPVASGEIVVLAPLSVEARAVRVGCTVGASASDRHGTASRRAFRAAGQRQRRARRPDRRILRRARSRARAGRRRARERAARPDRHDHVRRPVDPRRRPPARRAARTRRRRSPRASGSCSASDAGRCSGPVPLPSTWSRRGSRRLRARRPLVTLRVVLDTHRHELHRPLRTVAGAAIAYRTLRRACALVEEWANALGAREVVLAAPRASCAGVERAVEIVERALEQRGAPIYVRKQIVHNAHVVASLEARGAVFVDELDEVPTGCDRDLLGARCLARGPMPGGRARPRRDRRHLPAGGEGPRRGAALRRGRLRHRARRPRGPRGGGGHLRRGAGAHACDRSRRSRSADLAIEDPERVAYLTQTTLAVDETREVVDALRARFPVIAGPPSSDICYATQNRQDAVRALAADCDLILVVGSGNSSNSRRLVEVAERAGCRAMLVEGGRGHPARGAGRNSACRPDGRRLRAGVARRGRGSCARRTRRRDASASGRWRPRTSTSSFPPRSGRSGERMSRSV